MELQQKHYDAIEYLVSVQFAKLTQAEKAHELGITDRTLRAWKSDEDFSRALSDARMAWSREISHLRFTHRRCRIEELTRLYDATPDSGIAKIVKSDKPIVDEATGKMIVDDDGKPVNHIAVRTLNVSVKADLLSQIAEEVGGDVAEELADLQDEIRELHRNLKGSLSVVRGA